MEAPVVVCPQALLKRRAVHVARRALLVLLGIIIVLAFLFVLISLSAYLNYLKAS